MINNKLAHPIIEYILFLILLYLSATIFGISYYYKTVVFIALCAVMISFIFFNDNKQLNRNGVLVWVSLSLVIIFTALINNVSSYSSYFAIILQLFTALVFTQIINYKTFVKIYTNSLVFFAFVSIICFFVYQLFPRIALLFPYVKGTASLDYYNAYIYVFGAAKGYGTFVPFYRNMGICWEPGAYQAFLNLALIMLIDNENRNSSKKIIFKIVVLVIAVLTTYSTTGYLILLLVIISKWKKIVKLLKINSIVLGLLMSLFALIIIGSSFFDFSFFAVKINNEFGDSLSFIGRLGLSNLKFLYLEPLSIFGMSFEKYSELTYQLFDGIVGNSWLQSLFSLGFIFTIGLTIMYGRFCKKSKNSMVLFLVLMIMFWTESLFWRPIFLCLAWYGIDNRQMLIKNNDVTHIGERLQIENKGFIY